MKTDAQLIADAETIRLETMAGANTKARVAQICEDIIARLGGDVASALTDAAPVVWDASLGKYFTLTLGGNRTISNPTNTVDGTILILKMIAGSYTPTWGNNFVWSGGVAPTPTSGGSIDFYTFIVDGGKLYGVQTPGFAA